MNYFKDILLSRFGRLALACWALSFTIAGFAVTDVNWMGTNANCSVTWGANWNGYARTDELPLGDGTLTPHFSTEGTNVVIDMPVKFYGMAIKAPASGKQGVTFAREPGVGGRNATIGLMKGGIEAQDGTSATSTTAANRRLHLLEPPIVAYESQTWNLWACSSLWFLNGFSDGGVSGVRIEKSGNGSLALFGTNTLVAGSSFVVPGVSGNANSTVSITGAVHLAGSFVISNGNLNVTGRLAGPKGALNLAEPQLGRDGTFVYRQSAAAKRLTLSDAEIAAPLWIIPYTSGYVFFLANETYNVVKAPVTVSSSSSTLSCTINTRPSATLPSAEVVFEDRIVASNCTMKLSGLGRATYANRRVAENGGNIFYILSVQSGTMDFSCTGNAFVKPDAGGLLFDYGNANPVHFGVDCAITNGTFHFGNAADSTVSYKSVCNLGCTSQRIDRLVGVCKVPTTGAVTTNAATLTADGGWLEIAGNGLASTNGICLSNCVNIVKTGSAYLLFYRQTIKNQGALILKNGLTEFESTATWPTSDRVVVEGPAELKLNAKEQFSPRTRLTLNDTVEYDEWQEPVVTNFCRLTLPAGVTQTVASVCLNGSFATGGIWGNTNFNAHVVHHTESIQGEGVLKVGFRGSIFRFR